MRYEIAKKAVCAEFLGADGYAGKKSVVGLALIEGTAYEVYPFGCIPSPRPGLFECSFTSENEMINAAKASGYFFERSKKNGLKFQL